MEEITFEAAKAADVGYMGYKIKVQKMKDPDGPIDQESSFVFGTIIRFVPSMEGVRLFYHPKGERQSIIEMTRGDFPIEIEPESEIDSDNGCAFRIFIPDI